MPERARQLPLRDDELEILRLMMEDYRYELRARANRRKVGVDVNGLVLFLLAVANLAVIVVSVFGHHG